MVMTKSDDLRVVACRLLEAQDLLGGYPVTATMTAAQIVNVCINQMCEFGLTDFLISRCRDTFAVNGQEGIVSRPEILSKIIDLENIRDKFLETVWPEIPTAVCSIFTSRLNESGRLFAVVPVEVTPLGFHITITRMSAQAQEAACRAEADDGEDPIAHVGNADYAEVVDAVANAHAGDDLPGDDWDDVDLVTPEEKAVLFGSTEGAGAPDRADQSTTQFRDSLLERQPTPAGSEPEDTYQKTGTTSHAWDW